MGRTDRIVRLVVALGLSGLYLAGVVHGTWAIVALTVAAIFALTAFISFCPIYPLLGISTCRTRKASARS